MELLAALFSQHTWDSKWCPGYVSIQHVHYLTKQSAFSCDIWGSHSSDNKMFLQKPTASNVTAEDGGRRLHKQLVKFLPNYI